jgi:hypothetical protein
MGPFGHMSVENEGIPECLGGVLCSTLDLMRCGERLGYSSTTAIVFGRPGTGRAVQEFVLKVRSLF